MGSKLPPTPPPGLSAPSGGSRFGLFLFCAVLIVVAFIYIRSPASPVTPVAYSDFLALINDDTRKPGAVTIYDGAIIQWQGSGRELYKAVIPYEDPSLLASLRERGIRV